MVRCRNRSALATDHCAMRIAVSSPCLRRTDRVRLNCSKACGHYVEVGPALCCCEGCPAIAGRAVAPIVRLPARALQAWAAPRWPACGRHPPHTHPLRPPAGHLPCLQEEGARALRPRRRHRTGEVCHCARDRAPAGAGCGLGLGGVVGDDGLSRIQRRMVLLRFALEALGAGDLREQLACAEGAFWASGSSARNWVSVAAAAHSPTANRNRAWSPG